MVDRWFETPEGAQLEVNDFSRGVYTYSTCLVPANPHRVAVFIVNSGTHNVFLRLGESSPAAVDSGIRLNASGGSAVIDKNSPWAGSILAIADTATNNVTACEVYWR